MTDTPQSGGERHIEKIMQHMDPSSERYRVLETAKRFKSSWVELGEKLMEVNSHGAYREWGYKSFDEYCVQEIRIKRPTAEKLTMAYRYMEKEEPGLLARRDELKPLPDYRSVDLLRRAKEEKGFSDEEYAGLRKSIVEEERSHPTVLKQFKETVAARGEEPSDPVLAVKASLATARRLQTILSSVTELPEGRREQLASLIAYLEERIAGSEECS